MRDLLKEVLVQVHPRHAITRSSPGGRGETASLIPRLDESECFAAGGIPFEDLRQPCPKNRDVPETALALRRVDTFQKVWGQDRFKEKGVAAD